MLAFSRADCKQLWETFIPQNGVEYVHPKNGFASATPTTDGKLVYASFGRHGLLPSTSTARLPGSTSSELSTTNTARQDRRCSTKDRIFSTRTPSGARQSAFVGAFDRRRKPSGRRRAAKASAGAALL